MKVKVVFGTCNEVILRTEVTFGGVEAGLLHSSYPSYSYAVVIDDEATAPLSSCPGYLPHYPQSPWRRRVCFFDTSDLRSGRA